MGGSSRRESVSHRPSGEGVVSQPSSSKGALREGREEEWEARLRSEPKGPSIKQAKWKMDLQCGVTASRVLCVGGT